VPEKYEHQVIEPKWRKRWEETKLYAASDDDPRPKWYALTMFPYPSGDLHTGHWYAMAPSDVAARYRRMLGYNVMFPMGFDSFGLPAENAAIKRNNDPKEWTYQNIDRMREQLKVMGAGFDWDREVITSDPEYYKWTQWWFLQFYKRGLAYQAESLANWCPSREAEITCQLRSPISVFTRSIKRSTRVSGQGLVAWGSSRAGRRGMGP